MFLYIFSALESIIIPVPVDPYLAACVLARSKDWVRISLFTALASVMGGAIWLVSGFCPARCRGANGNPVAETDSWRGAIFFCFGGLSGAGADIGAYRGVYPASL